jgi:uncharacterized protein YaeQ
MAIKATIHKATIDLSDIDRQLYLDANFTLARHPSETDERMMVRLLAFTLHLPGPDNPHGPLEFARDMWEPEDEPALWQRDLTGRLVHWIDVGEPDERRMLRVSARVTRMSVYSFGPANWWPGIASKLTRLQNVTVWRLDPAQVEELAGLAERTMQLNVTVQDGAVYVGNGQRSVEVTPVRLFGPA